MRFLNVLFCSVLLLVFAAPSFAQMIEDPTSWKYEVKKKSATEYRLIFHLTLKPGWHIWSLHPGGDGYELAPTFTFDANPAVKMKGGITENGKKTVAKMDGIDGMVNYFAGKADYEQVVTVTGSAKITGKHEYQVCNDKMCLPPKDKDFVFEIKGAK